MADIERMKRALINADKAGDTAAATKLAAAIRAQMGGGSQANQGRIEQAFEVAEKPVDIRRGAILPFSSVDGDTRFDPDAGIPGMVKRGFMLPGQVMKGEIQLTGPDGRITDDALKRVNELASFAPAGVAARMVAKAGRLPLRSGAQAAKRNIDEAGEFGISLSKGQAGRKFSDQAFEEDALTGGKGGIAQKIMSRQREGQGEQVRTAAEGIRERVSRSKIDDPFEAAENVGSAVAKKAGELKEASQQAYRVAETFGGEVSPDATKTLSGSMRSILDETGAMEGTAVGSDLPVVKRIMGGVANLAEMKNAPEGDIIGVGWQNFERIRRQITNAKGSNPNEARILGEMRRGMDEWLEKTVDDGLVSGSPEFLDALKNARGLWRQYSDIAKSPTQIVRKMAKREADSVEIANWLYGTSKVGGRTQSAGVVREIKKVIGAESPAFHDLKRNVLTRLFEDVRNGNTKTFGRLAGDIAEFTNGKGRELAKALYDEDTIRELNKFAGVMRNLTPDSAATNPSRSGQTIMRRLADSMRILAPALGWSIGDVTGLIGGLSVAGASSMRSAARARASAQARVPSQAIGGAARPMNVIGRPLVGQALGRHNENRVMKVRSSLGQIRA